MKAVLIIHNAAIDEEVNEALKTIGISCYTKFPNTLGKGQISEPHLNTDVWPETNCGTFIVAEADKCKQVMEKVRQMRERLGPQGLKAFMWQVEDVT